MFFPQSYGRYLTVGVPLVERKKKKKERKKRKEKSGKKRLNGKRKLFNGKVLTAV